MIREYQNADWPEVMKLYKHAQDELVETGPASFLPSEFVRSITNPLDRETTAGVVVTENGLISGYILGKEFAKGVFWLHEIYLEPPLRGSGICYRAYLKAEDVIKARGYKFILSGNWYGHDDLSKLHEAVGYRPMSISHYKALR